MRLAARVTVRPVSGPVKLGGLSNLHHTVRSDEVQPGSQLMLTIFRLGLQKGGSAEAPFMGHFSKQYSTSTEQLFLSSLKKIRAAEALLCQGSLQSDGGKNLQQSMILINIKSSQLAGAI